jgi:UPF0755 protein
MTIASVGLWLKTALGLVAVYVTVPLLVLVWGVQKVFAGVIRKPLVLVVLVVVFACSYGAYWLYGSSGNAAADVELEVPAGMSFRGFTDTLASLGVIQSPTLFRTAARLGGLDRNLHVGLYRFSPDDSPYRILQKLARHEQIYLRFTVVEGGVMREFLPDVARALGLSTDSLWAEVRDPERVAQQGVPTGQIEGYLFPETYSMPWGATAADVVDAMTEQFRSVWLRISNGYKGGLSLHQAVTLASLIEAEAQDGAERGRISSVFHNRLGRRMRLQCDPTIIYAMGGLDRPLYRKDWEYESPYNTYRVFGLPPGPICSPGEASLTAALFPETTDYLYFVARGDGTHKFSRTLAEHEAAFNEIKRNRK